jgi:hypothetical protein
MKKIIIALLVSVTLALFGFYFFQDYQIKKQIRAIVTENKNRVSFEEISTSGLPTAKQITIKNLSYTAPSGETMIFEKITGETKAFSTTFSISNIGRIKVKTPKDNSTYVTEFNPDSKIIISTSDDKLSNIDFTTSGYKILDEDGKIFTTFEAKDLKTSLSISDMSQYKYNDSGFKILDKNGKVIFEGESTFIDLKWSSNDKDYTASLDANFKNFEYNDLSSLYKIISKKIIPEEQQAIEDEQTDKAISQKTTNKNSFAISTKFTISKNDDKLINLLPEDQMNQLPEEMKTQFQKKPTPYNVTLTLQNLEFFNSLYKISLNGSVYTYAEDNLPSGLLSLRLENFDNLINSINESMDEMTKVAETKKLSLSPDNDLPNEEITNSITANNSEPREELNNDVPQELITFIKDLANKNAASQENVLIFDFKREKGDGFNLLINEEPLAQIMMEFMQSSQKAKALDSEKKLIQKEKAI